MKQITRIIIAAIFLISCASCLTPQKNTVTQFSFIDAILAGAYDGQAACSELLSHGNLGIGTFDKLDGEMILLDGVIYQVRFDGAVHTPDPATTTPFACVTKFNPDKIARIPAGTNFDGFRKLVDQAVPNQNVFCALKAHGRFTSVLTRSVPPQKKPYPPLVEVTKNQPEFQLAGVSGTIVGFRTPPYAKGIGVPGYHLHFISDDKNSGGHVLALNFEQGTVEIDVCNRFVLIVPDKDSPFENMDFSKDRSKELEKAETR